MKANLDKIRSNEEDAKKKAEAKQKADADVKATEAAAKATKEQMTKTSTAKAAPSTAQMTSTESDENERESDDAPAAKPLKASFTPVLERRAVVVHAAAPIEAPSVDGFSYDGPFDKDSEFACGYYS